MVNKGLEKFDALVESFANLPTIGKKTALRLAFHLCLNDPLEAMKLAHNIENALRFVKTCEQCGALSENELCEICTDEERQKNLLCITQSPKDVLVIEDSKSYNGLYFILNELDEEHIERLRKMAQKMQTKELIFAFTHGLNTDATIFYLEERLKDLNLKFSKIAQGIPNGVNLENVDFISLRQALIFRTPVD